MGSVYKAWHSFYPEEFLRVMGQNMESAKAAFGRGARGSLNKYQRESFRLNQGCGFNSYGREVRRDSPERAFGCGWFQRLNLSQIVAESRLEGRSPDWERLRLQSEVIPQIGRGFDCGRRSFTGLGGASTAFEGRSQDWEGLRLRSKVVHRIGRGFDCGRRSLPRLKQAFSSVEGCCPV